MYLWDPQKLREFGRTSLKNTVFTVHTPAEGPHEFLQFWGVQWSTKTSPDEIHEEISNLEMENPSDGHTDHSRVLFCPSTR